MRMKTAMRRPRAVTCTLHALCLALVVGDTLRKGAWLDQTKHTRTFGRSHAPVYYRQTTVQWLINLLNQRATRSMDIYEFGVYTGDRMRDFAKRVVGFGHLWGFDSFTGIPNGMQEWIPHASWQAGGMSASDALKVWNEKALFEKLRQHIKYDNLSFVAGFYNESLTDELATQRHFQPALLVHLDCNLYVSTLQAMRWLLRYRLLLPSTIVRYDDWPGNMTRMSWQQQIAYWRKKGREPPPDPVWGQMRAHVEVTDEFRVEWRRLGRNAFEAVSIGVTAQPAISPEATAHCRFPPCF